MRLTVLISLLVAMLAAPVLADNPTSLAFDPPASHHAAIIYTASLDAQSSEPGLTPPVPIREAARAHRTTIFGLPRNIGPIDRIARAAIGTALAGVGIWGLSTSGHLSDTTSGILLGVSAIPFATAATGYCPLYQVLGVDETF